MKIIKYFVTPYINYLKQMIEQVFHHKLFNAIINLTFYVFLGFKLPYKY